MSRKDNAAVRNTVVALAVASAAAALYLTGWATIAKNVVALAWRGNAVTNLARRTPFTPPAGGSVSEQRLEAYLQVCGRIKPFGDKIDEWEAEHAEGRRVSFKGRAAGLVEAYLHEFNLALEQRQMGPTEFAWIESRMRETRGPGSEAAPAANRALYAKYRDRLEGSTLGPHARRIALGFAQ
jgi:hypothetical protein